MKRVMAMILTPLLCLGLTYFASLAAATAVVAENMPGWAQDEAWGWIQGTPQPVASDPGLPSAHTYTAGALYWEPRGYTGPTSFACMLPIQGPARMSSCFGDTEGRNGHPHTGVDWATSGEQGRQVWTPHGGMVTFAGWNYYLGWTVVIENGGWQVILGHLCCGGKGASSSPSGSPSLTVTEGEIVQAGDLVGKSGQTGNSTGPHVHFEIRHCDPEGSCLVVDPNRVILPGQDGLCPWETFGDGPPSTCQR
jgi:murein DD-endopeptidase MepM/ murein hydrolase activator NlpD